MFNQVFWFKKKILTCCLVDVQTFLSLSALKVPGVTRDGIK